MRPLRVLFIAALALAGLAGCSTHPIPDDVTRISTYGIVQQIRCEAGRAIRELAPNYTSAAIAYEFNFDITESDKLTNGEGIFALPFSSGAGIFSLTVNAGAEKTRRGVRNFRIVDSFTEAKKADCANDPLRKNLLYPIAGDIGAHEVLATFVKLQRAGPLVQIPPGAPAQPPSGSKPPTGEVFVFADRLKFTTTLSAGATPSLKMSAVPGRFRATSVKADLDARRIDMHQVTIAVAAGPEPIGSRSTGARLRSAPGFAPQTSNSMLATTLIQTQASAEQKALLELDRQRILELQARVPNLLVGQ